MIPTSHTTQEEEEEEEPLRWPHESVQQRQHTEEWRWKMLMAMGSAN